MTMYCSPVQYMALGLPYESLDGASFGIEIHLETATGIIDSYLRGRYSVPLSTPPMEVVNCCAIIAAFNFMCVRGWNPDSQQDRMIRVRYEDLCVGRPGQKSWLQQIADELVNLPIAADQTPAVHDGGPIVKSKRSRSRCRDC